VRQGGPSAFDTDPGTPAHYEIYNVPEPYSETFLLGNVDIQYHMPGIDFTSNTADFTRRQALVQDASEILAVAFQSPTAYLAGPVAFDAADDTRQFTQEFRAASAGDTRFKWLVGAYYSNLESTAHNNSQVPGLVPIVGTADLYTRSAPYGIKQGAIFGETSYQFTPELKATVGLRGFYYDTRTVNTTSGIVSVTGNGSFNTSVAAATASGENPKFDLTYTPSADLTVYGTVAKGFRPGGGSEPVPNNPATTEGAACGADLAKLGLKDSPTQYGPDSLWSYEVGEKSRFFDRRLTVDGSVYMIDWSGIQQGVSLPCGFSFTANSGRAKIYGSELEVRAVIVKGLEVNASGSYIDAHLSQGSVEAGTVKGDPLQTVPTWTTNVGLTYTHPLTGEFNLFSHIEYNFVGERANQAYLSLTPTPAYELTNARVGVTKGRWSATLFVDNLFNTRTTLSYLADQAENIPQYNRAISNQPLTAGIDISVRY
jgi:outer membrane receptor protein involved in Fe transport